MIVTFKETAVALGDIPQAPTIVNARLTPAESAGPPYGPPASRVSTTRHGVNVK